MPEALQEFVDSRGVTLRVDRDQGVLRGVKLIGLKSRNGRRYRESALVAAATLYEDAKVNVNHPKEGPLSPRDYQDRIGVIRDVELRSGAGLFGDLHFNPKHALAEQLLWDAEHNPQNVGFSHNVLARLSREGEVAVVQEITKVQSVDLVADPATTQGLFEQASKSSSARPPKEHNWDALTKEVLQLHRPDLLEELQAVEVEQLQTKLTEAESALAGSTRRQRVLELLCEHQLSLHPGEAADSFDPSEVSAAFVESLMHVSEADLETLVFERAELARAATTKQRLASNFTLPISREQTLPTAGGAGRLASAEEFASALKSALN